MLRHFYVNCFSCLQALLELPDRMSCTVHKVCWEKPQTHPRFSFEGIFPGWEKSLNDDLSGVFRQKV